MTVSPDAFFREILPGKWTAFRDLAAGRSSVGSLCFRVPEAGEWTVRLQEGDLEVSPGLSDDVMLQVTIPGPDFEALVVEPIERVTAAGQTRPRKAASLRMLGADAETARLVRHVPGSVLFVVKDADLERRLLLTPGRRPAELERAACTIECSVHDFIAAESGSVSPMQLFTSGRLRISGNLQIAMALSSVLG